VEFYGTRLREMKRIEYSISFVFEPAEGYGKFLGKSTREL
jgi:hypothetical protein